MKNPWPYAIIAALVGIIAIQVVVVMVATSNKPVLESEDANGYESSLTWDAEREAFAASRALGWRLELDTNDRAIEYRLTHDGQPLRGLVGEFVVARADGRALDRKVSPDEAAPGVYRVQRAGLPAGRYRIRAELRQGDRRWLDERWVMLP